MRILCVVAAAIAAALSVTPIWGSECSPAFNQAFAAYEHLIDSLRPEKPGVLRVYAANGDSYPGGQVLWMKGQVRQINQACARGDDREASQGFDFLRSLLSSKPIR